MEIKFKLESVEISRYLLSEDSWKPSDADKAGFVHLLKFKQVSTGLEIPRLGALHWWPQGGLQIALDSKSASVFQIGMVYTFAELSAALAVEGVV